MVSPEEEQRHFDEFFEVSYVVWINTVYAAVYINLENGKGSDRESVCVYARERDNVKRDNVKRVIIYI